MSDLVPMTGPAKAAIEALAEQGWKMTPLGLQVPSEYTIEEWTDAGKLLLTADRDLGVAMRFMLGDWYNANKWGEMGEAVTNAFPEEKYDTIKKYGYVASRFQFGTRVPNCRWNQYLQLAPEDADVRAKMIRGISNGDLSPDEQRNSIRQLVEARRKRIAEQKSKLGFNGGLKDGAKPDGLPLTPAAKGKSYEELVAEQQAQTESILPPAPDDPLPSVPAVAEADEEPSQFTVVKPGELDDDDEPGDPFADEVSAAEEDYLEFGEMPMIQHTRYHVRLAEACAEHYASQPGNSQLTVAGMFEFALDQYAALVGIDIPFGESGDLN